MPGVFSSARTATAPLSCTWYAVHGRMLASETTSKAWLLHDSLRFHRSDAALIRIVVGVDGADIDAAQREGLAFAHDVLPYLPRLWS